MRWTALLPPEQALGRSAVERGHEVSLFLATIATYALTVPTVHTPPPMRPFIGPAWQSAAHVRLQHDLNYRDGDRGEATDVYIEADAAAVYVAFVCEQNVPIVAEQQTNNSGVESDDYVTVKFWPGGATGVTYSFSATPRGVHDQSSSENTAFAPQWNSVGAFTNHGYTVVMSIPRSVMHGDGRRDWPIQFARYVQKNSLRLVWSYDPAESYAGDPTYAGTAHGIGTTSSKAAARPRIQPYLLAQTNAPAVHQAASRMGLDFSVPVARSTSVYGTVHPDYSEVERDQQTIAPSEFAYRYSEVRPFFTQANTYFDPLTLYTPAIPTPRYGYAVEGTQHGFRYAGFDAPGQNGRDDNAQNLTWSTENQRYFASVQRVAVRFGGFSDTATSYTASVGNGKHFSVFAQDARDAGTLVTDASKATYDNVGFNLYGPTSSFYVERTDYGAQFTPADSYVTYLDAHGYQAGLYDQRNYASPCARFQSLTFNWFGDRYRNSAGQVNQVDSTLFVGAQNRHQTYLNVFFDVSRGLDPQRGMVPYDQSGISIFNRADPRRSVGAGYYAGHFYNGYLQNPYWSLSVKVRPKESIAFSDQTYIFRSPVVGREVERLDSLTYTFEYGKDGSLAAGVRWITGTPAYFFALPGLHQTNMSFSLNHRLGDWHAYLVYGDPNARNTIHSAIFKLVRFIGAGEGS